MLCVLWAWSGTDALVHSVVVQHSYCDDHGTVEDHSTPQALGALASVDQGTAGSVRLADEPGDEEHDSCLHTATSRKQSPALVPSATPLLPPPTFFVVSSFDAKHLEADRPRGPPLYLLAPKTSPPRSA